MKFADYLGEFTDDGQEMLLRRVAQQDSMTPGRGRGDCNWAVECAIGKKTPEGQEMVDWLHANCWANWYDLSSQSSPIYWAIGFEHQEIAAQFKLAFGKSN